MNFYGTYYALTIYYLISIGISGGFYFLTNNILISASLLIVLLISSTLIQQQIMHMTMTDDHKNIQHQQKKDGSWITHDRIAELVMGLIVACQLGAYYLSITNLGYTDLLSRLTLVGITGGFGAILYYVYYLFYPSMYWHRNTLKNRKWKTTVDCRNYKEFEKGHYKGAIHWPIETLTWKNFRARLHELQSPVLVYDDTGKLSTEWVKRFDELSKEYGLKGYTIAHTDAHWTQMPKRKECDV